MPWYAIPPMLWAAFYGSPESLLVAAGTVAVLAVFGLR